MLLFPCASQLLLAHHCLPRWAMLAALPADAILGLYSDAQTECAARLLPEDRLGEVRVEQMVRKGFAGHCMVQVSEGGAGDCPQELPLFLQLALL